MRIFSLFLSLFCLSGLVLAQGSEIYLSRINFDEIAMGGFELTRERQIDINAVGAGQEGSRKYYSNRFYDPNDMFVYSWIINAETRELVWRMTPGNSRKTGEEMLREFNGRLTLPAGRYEVYLCAREPNKIFINDNDIPSLGIWLKRFFGRDKISTNFLSKCHLRVSRVDRVLSERETRDNQEKLRKEAVCSIANVRDSQLYEERFSLSKSGYFEVYALGESLEDGLYDYGWITREDNGEIVWEMKDENSEDAGGAMKNRLWRTVLKLESGNYSVQFVTDDSHSPEEWNANPPHDPYFWGIMLRGVPGRYDPGSVKEFRESGITPFVHLNRLGNNAFVEQAFELTRPTKLRIHALGEGSDGQMYDYGWIINARTGEKVWEMRFNDTRHAGGAYKNRVIDALVDFSPGAYKVYFVTDGSHSYMRWNTRPPRNGVDWGIRLELTEPEKNEIVKPFVETRIEPLLTLTGIGDDALESAVFHVDKTSKFRVVAVGEGRDGEMFDYGWIEDLRTGRRIWEMRFDKTAHAGGGSKNRQVDEILTVPPGDYALYYRSDDSHSFKHWNTRPPHRPERWGITLYPVENSSFKLMLTPPELPKMPLLNKSRMIAQIVEVHDNEHVRKTFELPRETLVHIYAIGEGDDDEMYDYGWIENRQTREVVWTMEYQRTEHAGGARKNRLARVNMLLPRGEYILHYISDDSHSFEDWNTTPPEDRFNYGITLYEMPK